MLPAVDLEALAALVRRLLGRLLDGQAIVGLLDVDAHALRVLDEGFEVHFRIRAEQRQAETALSLEGTVAGPAAAAELGEQRLHMTLEPRNAARTVRRPALRGGQRLGGDGFLGGRGTSATGDEQNEARHEPGPAR